MNLTDEDIEEARVYLVNEMVEEEFQEILYQTDLTCRLCTRCCIDYGIPEISKPAGVRCPYLTEEGLCEIYQDRPRRCRDFPHLKNLNYVKANSRSIFHVKSSCPVITEFIENILERIREIKKC